MKLISRDYITLRRFGFLFILLAFPSALYAQQQVKGKVLKKSDSTAVFGADVFLKNHRSTGTATNLKGTFKLKIPQKERKDTLVISRIGFHNVMMPLASINWVNITVYLSKDVALLNKITVTAQRTLAKEFSTKTLSSLSIVLSPVGDADPLKAITLIPASTNTSETANPELRGSPAGFSRVELNGSPLYNPVQDTRLNGLGGFSILSAELMDYETVYAGNPPLKYGNSIAGLVDVSTKDQIKAQRFGIAAGIGGGGLFYQQPFKNNSTFLQVFGNYQLSDAYLAVNKMSTPHLKNFKTQNVGLNFHSDITGRLSVNTYSYFINNGYKYNVSIFNYRGNIDYNKKRYFNIFNLKYTTAHFVFTLHNEFNTSNSNYTLGNIRSHTNVKQIYNAFDMKYIPSNQFSFSAGIDDNYFNDRFTGKRPVRYFAVYPEDRAHNFNHRLRNHNFEAFAYGRYTSGHLVIGAGLRKNIPVNGQKSYLSYQGSIRYDFFSHSSLHFSTGKYHGYTTPHYYIHRFAPIRATQYEVGYKYKSNSNTFGIAVYKKIGHTSQYFNDFGTANQTVHHIEGIEFSAKHQMHHFSFYASYTWLHSKFKRQNRWNKNSNDMNYLIKAALQYVSLNTLNFSVSYITWPGHYYTPVAGSRPVQTQSGFRPIYESINSQQLNRYGRFDLNINKVIDYKGVRIIPFFVLSNILNRHNYSLPVYSQNYQSILHYRYYQLRSVYFGVNISF